MWWWQTSNAARFLADRSGANPRHVKHGQRDSKSYLSEVTKLRDMSVTTEYESILHPSHSIN